MTSSFTPPPPPPPLSLELSKTDFATLAHQTCIPCLTENAKQALSKDYTTKEELDQALLVVSNCINDFFQNQQQQQQPSPPSPTHASQPKPAVDKKEDATTTTTTTSTSIGGTSESVYTLSTLELYDALVWHFNSPFLWRISPNDITKLYQDCVSPKHCEIAVGTGLFLTKVISQLDDVTLMDLNPNTMKHCQERLVQQQQQPSPKQENNDDTTHNSPPKQLQTDSIVCDITHKWDTIPSTLYGTFDSVAANFLIHCLHGGNDMTELVFENISKLLSPHGIFFGSTILGYNLNQALPEHVTPAALQTNSLYNDIGIFGNEQDSFEGIGQALHKVFEDVDVTQVGYCAVWKARHPKHSMM